MNSVFSRPLLRLSALFLALSVTAPAVADERVPPVKDALVLKECGGCHMAFQPALLPARSWSRLMDGLDRHFGEEIRLSSNASSSIRSYLSTHAGDRDGRPSRFVRHLAATDSPQRITETPAFVREHRFPERIWKNPKVMTPSNCPACHTAAEQGVYEDD